ncbi:MAG: NAD(P)H-dependent oxidoreductase subunit E [SAR202 cluster bacterium]|nr:NAD(P)H-dependent oxidoreductase subunit E [SAR202 cluster bacterium]
MSIDIDSLRTELDKKFPRERDQLLPALHLVQHLFDYLPDWAIEAVGRHLQIPASEVYGAATSYSELRTEKPGASTLKVCTGLGCLLNGGREVLKAVESALGTPPGRTTADGRITFEETPCGFLCGMAPAVKINDTWRGRVTSDSVEALIREAGRR